MKIKNNLEASFDWVIRNRNQFSVDSKDYDQKEKSIGALKPLGEYVLTMEVLISYNYKKDECLANVEWAWNQINKGKLLIEILGVRPDLIVLSSLYANFEKLGFYNERLKNLITYLLETKGCKNIEYPYWRRLDLIHTEDFFSLHHFPIDAEIKCWFYNNPQPWIMSDDIAYALTHDIFYLTDFGRNKSRLSQNSIEYLKNWIPGWLKIFGYQPNWDIYSELIMVACCIGEYKIVENYIGQLIMAQENDGLIPSPEGAGRQLLEYESKPDKQRVKFLSNYHTCLVGLMALGMTNSELN